MSPSAMMNISADTLKDSVTAADHTAIPATAAKGGSLCARSLAALEATSLFISSAKAPASCSGRSQCSSISGPSNVASQAFTDVDKEPQSPITLGKGNPAERILRALKKQSINSDKSTDDSASDSDDASWLPRSPCTWTDGATSDSDIASVKDEPLPSSAAEDVTDLTIYPIAILLQLRAAALRARGPPAPVRYTTQRIPQASTPSTPCAAVTPSSTAWTPSRRQRGQSGAGEDEDAQVGRVARSILNKLTLEKFDSLYEQLATSGVRTPAQVTILMREIFEKATAQHHFIAMYTDLCVCLEADPRISAAAETDGKSTFRRLLLNQCQIAFEELLEPRGEIPCGGGADAEEAKLKVKQRALGNVKFVGQLLVRGMLSSRLLCSCSEQLLSCREACPEALESLAVLLTVAGPAFDYPEWPLALQLSSIFARVRETTGDLTVPARIRFLLRDLLDLREAGWPSHARTAAKVAGPMRLAEVAQAAATATEPTKVAATGHRGKPVATPPAQTTADKRLAEKRITALQDIVKAKPAKDEKKDEKERDRETNKTATAATGPSGKKPQQVLAKQQTPAVRVASVSILSLAEAAPAWVPSLAAAASCKDAPAGGSKRTSGGHRRTAAAPGKTCPEAPAAAAASTGSAATVAPVAQLVQASATAAVPAPAPAAPKAQVSAAPTPTPVTAAPAPAVSAPPAFSPSAFHKELSAAFRDLGADRNVAAAVRRVRACAVPPKYQAREFADILTRAAEESRGPARRSAFAFAAGLCAAADGSAFLKTECLAGVKLFFQDVYEDLCEEIPRLPAIAAAEVLPTLCTVLPAAQLAVTLPPGLRVHSLLPEELRNAATSA